MSMPFQRCFVLSHRYGEQETYLVSELQITSQAFGLGAEHNSVRVPPLLTLIEIVTLRMLGRHFAIVADLLL